MARANLRPALPAGILSNDIPRGVTVDNLGLGNKENGQKMHFRYCSEVPALIEGCKGPVCLVLE